MLVDIRFILPVQTRLSPTDNTFTLLLAVDRAYLSPHCPVPDSTMRKVRLIAAVLLVLCVVGAYAAEKNPSQNGHSGTGTQEKTAQTTQSKQQQLPKAAIAVIKPQQQPVGEFCKLACSKGNPAGNPAFDFYQLVRCEQATKVTEFRHVTCLLLLATLCC